MPDSNSSPYFKPVSLLVPPGCCPLPTSSVLLFGFQMERELLERKLSLKAGARREALLPPTLSSPPPAPREAGTEGCRCAHSTVPHPTPNPQRTPAFSGPRCPHCPLEGPGRGRAFLEELSARQDTHSICPGWCRCSKSRVHTGRWKRQRGAEEAQESGPDRARQGGHTASSMQGWDREFQVAKKPEDTKAEASSSRMGRMGQWGVNSGDSSWPCLLGEQPPLCWGCRPTSLKWSPRALQDLEGLSHPQLSMCRKCSYPPRAPWAPRMAAPDRNCHPPFRNMWQTCTEPSLRAGPSSLPLRGTWPGKGLLSRGSQNPGGFLLSSAAPVGSRGPDQASLQETADWACAVRKPHTRPA